MNAHGRGLRGMPEAPARQGRPVPGSLCRAQQHRDGTSSGYPSNSCVQLLSSLAEAAAHYRRPLGPWVCPLPRFEPPRCLLGGFHLVRPHLASQALSYGHQEHLLLTGLQLLRDFGQWSVLRRSWRNNKQFNCQIPVRSQTAPTCLPEGEGGAERPRGLTHHQGETRHRHLASPQDAPLPK